MVSLKLLFTVALLQIVIEMCHGMCDQRPFGGKLKCCTKKDSNCFVKVNNSRRRGNQNTICYCDDYCKFTNDCCSDVSKVKSLCRRQAKNCEVSSWQAWGKCSAKCGIGFMKRTRRILQTPENGGESCPVLRQTRGCNVNRCDNTKNKYKAAIVLPINFRREKFGDYGYENILPAINENDNNVQSDYINRPTYSYCVHYRHSYKREMPVKTRGQPRFKLRFQCVECQSRVMNGGHCRGEGAIGVRTRWKALGVARCHGDWIRLGDIIPNCTCKEKKFANFVFV
ncbi:LOW QUALITY PROTEIN: somatomedin-B and thrombospondin type-1 domain-containing protein-like [Clytia hemisphaerica]|uniref:LOW QUALITY PROTEIN: somatomedin-B and thrombospondin type-1 domain-containing protein-like n=1 Tax=Clytia hemisphaerica TaxID=252671 RepID=UPI0034D6DA0D